ncbi:uncharacterized protein [Lolium perenne]|uniref:uncharacterized protein n=1 Tax=Lolium perenne TaxID=4522 RepID=UPI003A9A5705
MHLQHQQHSPAALIQGQQMFGESQACDIAELHQLIDEALARGFDDEIPMPAPIAHVPHDFQAAPFHYVQHPQDPVTALLHQQTLGEGDASAFGFHDQMPMPAPIAQGQHDFQFQAAPSDYVQHPQHQDPVTDLQQQHILGEASGYGFQDQMPMQANIAQGLHDFQAAPSDYVQHHQDQDPMTAIQHRQILGEASTFGFHDQMPMQANIAQGQHGFQAGPSDYVQHPQLPATAVLPPQVIGESPAFGLHDQILGDASAFNFHDQLLMPAPIADGQHGFQAAPADYVQHPQLPTTAVLPQQVIGESQVFGLNDQLLADASAVGFHDQLPMLAPIADGQHGFQAGPSDYVQHLQVPDADIQSEQIIFEASAYGLQDQLPTPPSGGSEEDVFSLPPIDDSSEMMQEYLMDNVAVEFVSDQAVNHAGGSGATGLMEDEMDFVPLWPGRLECDHCHVLGKIRSQSETRQVFIFLHSAADGSIQHAIMEINYHGDDIQAPKLYIDFSRQTREFVLNFIRNKVELLRKETGGAVLDSHEVAQNSNIIEAPPPSPPQDAEPSMEATADNNVIVNGLPEPPVFQSFDEDQENQPSESAEVHSSMPRMQQERAAPPTLEEKAEEIRQYLQELKENAQRELNTNDANLKIFCRRTNCTWKVVRVCTYVRDNIIVRL